jgi:Sodium/calcium exchanger protein
LYWRALRHLVLALAVTLIETALIVSVMLSAPAENVGLARGTVFAAIMIVCNGIVGACLLWGVPLPHSELRIWRPGLRRMMARNEDFWRPGF